MFARLEMGKREEQIRIKMQGKTFIDNCFFFRPVNKKCSV
jgi:hypothetical protein